MIYSWGVPWPSLEALGGEGVVRGPLLGLRGPRMLIKGQMLLYAELIACHLGMAEGPDSAEI